MERSEVIEKVKALWSLADHPNTPQHEAASAVNMAQKLMAKFEIDEIVLQEKSGKREEVVLSDIRITTFEDNGKVKGIVPDQRLILAHFIATNNRCRCVIVRKQPSAHVQTGKPTPGGDFITVCGYRSDVEMTRELYTELSADMLTQILGEAQTADNYRKNFADGYAVRINERLRGIKREVEVMADQVGTSTALVLRDRSAAVEDFFDKMFPNLKTQKVTTMKYDPAAQERGRAAANRADVGQTKVGEGTRGSLNK